MPGHSGTASGFKAKPVVRTLAVGLPLVVFLVFGAMYFSGLDANSPSTVLTNDRPIKVGYAVEAPYAFLEEDGTVTGLAPELARQVISRLGARQIVWRLVEFDELIPELLAGRIDVVAAGMAVTPERKKQVAFSRPIAVMQNGLLVKKGNPLGISTYESILAADGASVAVLAGSMEEAEFQRMGVLPSRLKVVPNAGMAFDALNSNLVQAIALTVPTLRWGLAKGLVSDAELVDLGPAHLPGGSEVFSAFAFRHDDDLLPAWDSELIEVMNTPDFDGLLGRFWHRGRGRPGMDEVNHE